MPTRTQPRWRVMPGTEYTVEIWTDESHGSLKIAECAGMDRAQHAALIVQAVNSHAALVEACQLAQRLLLQGVSATDEEFARLDAALRLAGEEGP